MNAENILTAVITGILTGGITGYLATLYAMRQFKAQRAFDRQLEWYERTVRALGTLLQRVGEEVFMDIENPELWNKAVEDWQREVAIVWQCVNEAVLYAEQSSYEQLQEMVAKIKKGEDREAAANKYAITREVLLATLTELSKPVRKMLGLKGIVFRK